MTRPASACVALLLACAACGEDASPRDQGLMPSDQMDATTSAPVEDAQGLDGSTSATSQDAATSTTPEAGSAGGSDAGSSTKPEKDASMRPALVLEVPTSTVPCGGKPCDTLANVCCESWSKGTGFGATQSCVTRDQCQKMFSRSGEQNRAIPHECDGKEDCSGGQVCCLYAPGQPLCEFADLAMCISKLFGPGGAGICVDDDKCKLGSTQFVAEGVPLGILACNDNADCADRAGTSCQAEESNSISTGKGVNARSHIKVCR
jgi:hypothetical protein